MPLLRNPNIGDADGIYNAIIDAHRGLNDKESAALNARLVLLLANHIGDESVIREALAVAQALSEVPVSS
jgi:hypothetical protein